MVASEAARRLTIAERTKAPGRYQVLRRLATGGMGELYLARMRGIEGFERLVVLKRLKPDVAMRVENVKMFLDEVRVLASVQHANVVHIYDVGTTKEGHFYYAMEFLVGQDLRAIMNRASMQAKPLPLPQTVYIAASVLAGLHHVHLRTAPDGSPLKIVHRDVSPANIFITYDGGVKLIDFGIAKTTHQTSETAHGTMKGKFRYMSPEQCRIDPIDARSDLFSLGIVLWELTTGRALYKTTNDIKTLFTIVEVDAPKPSSLVPEYPPELEAIVMKALARRPSDRWSSAKEMQLALEDFALDQRWPQTANSLTELMEARFPKEVAELHGAQQAGHDMANFVLRQLDEAVGQPTGGSLAGAELVKEPTGSLPCLQSSSTRATPAETGHPTGSAVTPAAIAMPPPLPLKVSASVAAPQPLRARLGRSRLLKLCGVAALVLAVAVGLVSAPSQPERVAPLAPAALEETTVAPTPASTAPPAPPTLHAVQPKGAPPVDDGPMREVEKRPEPRTGPPAVAKKKAPSPPPPAAPVAPPPSENWDKDSPLPPP